MIELWIPLKDIPAEGQDHTFTDQSLWAGPMREFDVAGKIGQAFSATMRITPQEGGFLVSGGFSGSIVMPCVRCVEKFELPLSGRFDSFEETGHSQDELEEQSHLRVVKGAPELDAAGYLWEQFLLAMPENPICSADCKGLCPNCGVNRNRELCACAEDKGDPRLAVLRNLKLH
ncbi:MAG: hypothetical protein AUJ49_11105 [Desulfovibrionaceae bacterium CG1_02_65_16]|nr:MAG: hypothetical protein AUJ49_11105 [Desulfovibrionaceae bacterium CG1_02_65_16]